MILFVDGINQGVQCTNVGYGVADYESAFGLLTELVNQGWTLLNATIHDNDARFCVPVEAFDGQPVAEPVRALTQQWQAILSRQPPTFYGLTGQQLGDWLTQLDTYYEEQLVYLQLMRSRLELVKSGLVKQRDERLRLRLGQQYDSLLRVNQRMLKKTEESWLRNRKRLNELENER